jgi:hypothetical protein
VVEIKGQQLAITEFLSGYGTYGEIQDRAGLSTHHIMHAVHLLSEV